MFPGWLLVLDFGGSLTKVSYTGSDGQLRSMSMEPEVLALPQASIDSYESSKMGMDLADKVDKAWVGSLDQF